MTCVRIEGQANALVQDAGIGLLGQLTHDTTRRLHVRCSGHDGGVVVLPKHWSGRWDVTKHIHKLWVVHDHPDVPDAPTSADGVTRAVVFPSRTVSDDQLLHELN